MELAEKELFDLIEPSWKNEIKYYITDIEISKIIKNNNVKHIASSQICQLYNNNKYSPIDGEIIKVADELAAFMEAYMAIQTGVKTKDLEEGLQKMLDSNRDKIVAGIDISAIYSDFS